MVRSNLVWRGTLRQPFAVSLFNGIWNAHPRFMTRTVMVENNDVDGAFHLLNRLSKKFCDYSSELMEREGLMKIIRSTQRYIKPFQQRKLLAMEASNAILDEDLRLKMRFLARKQRLDAYPGQLTT